MDLASNTVTQPLQLTRHYNAKPEQVYAAWTDPDALGQWFGPSSHTCQVEKMDVREGGEYRIRMIPTGAKDPECGGDTSQDSICGGKYLSLIVPEKIVMSFSWLENGSDIGDTTLTIELFAANGGTDLVLTHTGLPDEEAIQAHSHGWTGTLQGLTEFMQG